MVILHIVNKKLWVSTNGGTPIAGWFLLGKIPLNLMIWVYPHLWNPPIVVLFHGRIMIPVDGRNPAPVDRWFLPL